MPKKKTTYILPMVGSYEGDEPFVYASYDRADGDIVATILANAKKNGARISFDPERMAEAMTMVVFLSRNSRFSRLVRRDLENAKALYMDVVCFYIDDSYLGQNEERESGFRYVRLDEVSILQYGPILESFFPIDVYPGPPKKVVSDN